MQRVLLLLSTVFALSPVLTVPRAPVEEKPVTPVVPAEFPCGARAGDGHHSKLPRLRS